MKSEQWVFKLQILLLRNVSKDVSRIRACLQALKATHWVRLICNGSP